VSGRRVAPRAWAPQAVFDRGEVDVVPAHRHPAFFEVHLQIANGQPRRLSGAD